MRKMVLIEDVFDDIELPVNIEIELHKALELNIRSPQKVRSSFTALLEHISWNWPWLNQYPETFEGVTGYPKNLAKARAQLLANTLMRFNNFAFNEGRIARAIDRKSYILISAVGDNCDLNVCKKINGKIIKAEHAYDSVYMPLHCPNCRCCFSILSERRLKARGLEKP